MRTLPTPLHEPKDPPSRHTALELPAYRHVPGLTPHPVRHPEGHSFAADEIQPAGACRRLPEGWQSCEEYLWGVDLFNWRYLWEAHEAWELIWIGAGKTSVPGRFAQGLIQVSAGLLRLHLGTPAGARSLLVKARRNLTWVQSGEELLGGVYMGLAIEDWWRSVERFVGSPADTVYPFLRLDC